jgi:hypothetical protein
MSEEGGFGLALAERFFGLILLIVGALAMYYTVTTFTTSEPMPLLGFFGFLSLILLVLGLLFIIAKIE